MFCHSAIRVIYHWGFISTICSEIAIFIPFVLLIWIFFYINKSFCYADLVSYNVIIANSSTQPLCAFLDQFIIFCLILFAVENLIYWRDPKKTGPIFGGVLVVLLALTYFSFISVAAYLSLFALTGTISFRIYKNIVQAVQKTGDGHPFK